MILQNVIFLHGLWPGVETPLLLVGKDESQAGVALGRWNEVSGVWSRTMTPSSQRGVGPRPYRLQIGREEVTCNAGRRAHESLLMLPVFITLFSHPYYPNHCKKRKLLHYCRGCGRFWEAYKRAPLTQISWQLSSHHHYVWKRFSRFL